MGCGSTLFLANGGRLTCSFVNCPAPDAAHILLSREAQKGYITSENEDLDHSPYSVPPGYVVVSEDYHYACVAARELLQDLDRSEHGRHKGDVESEDPSGVSQGNPQLVEGQHIGYHLSRRPIVVPAPERLGDPPAWIQEATGA